MDYLNNSHRPRPLPHETVLQVGKGAEDCKKRNKQAGEKALDLPARSRFGEGRAEPLTNYILRSQGHERIALPGTRTFTLNFKCPHSKGLELDCLFRPFRPSDSLRHSLHGKRVG